MSQLTTDNQNERPSGIVHLGKGRFAVRASVGTGGMGSVFTAFDEKKRENVALKNLGKLDAEAIHAFKLEFRDFKHLHHPNLVGMDEFFEDRGSWYFSMEYVPGKELLAHIRKSPQAKQEITSPPTLIVDESGPIALEPSVVYRAYPGRIDEDAVKDALRQLLNGLTLMHTQGKVHRDIKSPNIIVQEDGRLVLIDFGVAMKMFGRPVALAGTPLYMAPEAFRRAASPMSDWYAVGVVLYQAITGRDPFEGELGEMILQKRARPVHPCAIAPEAPEDLADLCMGLMEPRPDLRGGRRTVIEYLEGYSDRRSGVRTIVPFPETREVVVGREKEQKALWDAYAVARARPTGPTLVRVEGESGIGKTLLIEDFLETLQEKERAIILRATVIEEELVPYKAVDGVIDALADFFVALDYDDVPNYFSDGFEVVCDTFPVLRRAARLAELPKATIPDPVERRLRMFASLKDCLRRVGAAHPLVVLVDDIQWTDADSLVLWNDLLAGPTAPKMMHITSIRSSTTPSLRPSKHASPLNDALRDLPAFPRPEIEISVNRFSTAEAEAYILDRVRLGVTTRNMGRMTEIARESVGHPLFIEELLTFDGEESERPLTLEGAFDRRIRLLSPENRAFLEVACASAKPIPTWIVGRAAGLRYADYLRATKALREARLIKTGRKTGHHADDWVEPFHSRVGYACIAAMSDERRTKCHRAIAETLESYERTDFELLAVEWRDAGDAEKAGRYYEKAGDNSVKLLTFKKAVELYEAALSTFTFPTEERLDVMEKLGRAHRGAGQGKRAADTFLAIAAEVGGDRGFGLRCEAAELTLISGYVEAGREIVEGVLREVGMSLPKSRRVAFASFISGRTRIAARGYDFKIEKDVTPTDLNMLDAMWAVCVGYSIIDPIRCFDYTARYVLKALDVGEPVRVAQALGGDACVMAARGGKHTEEAFRLITIAEQLDQKYNRVTPVVCQGRALAHMLSGQWREALVASRTGQALLRKDLVGPISELASLRQTELWALFFLGQLEELHRFGTVYLQEAKGQENLYGAIAVCSGYANFGWLAYEGCERAQTIAREAMQPWMPGEIHMQHFFHMIADVNAHLSIGDVSAAIAVFRHTSKRLHGALVMESQMNRILMTELEARLALADARSPGSAAGVRAAVGRLRQEQRPWSSALASMFEAALELRAESRQAIILAAAAAEELRNAGLNLHAAVLCSVAKLPGSGSPVLVEGTNGDGVFRAILPLIQI